MATKISSSEETTPGYNNLRNRNIPKTISYFFLISQLFSGVDLGVSNLFKKNVRQCIRRFTILEACTYGIIFFTPMLVYPTKSTFVIIFPFLFEYVVNILIFLNYKKYTTCDFLCDISEFCKLTKNETYVLIFISIINYIIASFSKILIMITITVCDVKLAPYFDQMSSLISFSTCLIYLILDLVAIPQIVIFYYVYSSMKHLKFILISTGQELHFISKQYRAIIEICENIRPLSDSLVSKILL